MHPFEELGDPIEWCGNESIVLSLLDVHDSMLLSGFLDLSPVSGILESINLIELFLEKSKVLGFDWVDGGEDVPEDESGAWWGSH